MHNRLLKSLGIMAAIVSVLSFLRPTEIAAQTATGTPSATTAPVTPWGEPDLQGIWTVEFDTPLQRSPKYANQEFFTDTQREELDNQRSALLRRDKRVERGTELDVAGAYNALFM